jgi:hypothetical protein
MASTEELTIKIHPLADGNNVDYMQEIDIPVSVFNHSPETIVIESVVLRFQAEWNSSAHDAVHERRFGRFTIAPDREEYRKVSVLLRPILQSGTNVVDIIVTYLKEASPAKKLTQQRKEVFYLVVQPPPTTKGQLFISYKDPEDWDLAHILQRICERAGFVGYIAPADAKPGTDIWNDKIPGAVHNSKALVIIWSKVTMFGEGVQKEIALARDLGVPEVLILERNVPAPSEFATMEAEISWFERPNAPSDFSQAIVAYRLNHSS